MEEETQRFKGQKKRNTLIDVLDESAIDAWTRMSVWVRTAFDITSEGFYQLTQNHLPVSRNMQNQTTGDQGGDHGPVSFQPKETMPTTLMKEKSAMDDKLKSKLAGNIIKKGGYVSGNHLSSDSIKHEKNDTNHFSFEKSSKDILLISNKSHHNLLQLIVNKNDSSLDTVVKDDITKDKTIYPIEEFSLLPTSKVNLRYDIILNKLIYENVILPKNIFELSYEAIGDVTHYIHSWEPIIQNNYSCIKNNEINKYFKIFNNSLELNDWFSHELVPPIHPHKNKNMKQTMNRIFYRNLSTTHYRNGTFLGPKSVTVVHHQILICTNCMFTSSDPTKSSFDPSSTTTTGDGAGSQYGYESNFTILSITDLSHVKFCENCQYITKWLFSSPSNQLVQKLSISNSRPNSHEIPYTNFKVDIAIHCPPSLKRGIIVKGILKDTSPFVLQIMNIFNNISKPFIHVHEEERVKDVTNKRTYDSIAVTHGKSSSFITAKGGSDQSEYPFILWFQHILSYNIIISYLARMFSYCRQGV